MSLEKSLGETTNRFNARQEMQKKASEEKKLSSVRKSIDRSNKKEEKLKSQSTTLKDSYGLAGEELANFKAAKKIIDGLYKESKVALDKEDGIKTKQELIESSKYGKEEEIKDYKGSRQRLKKAVGKVGKIKKSLEKQGIEKTARKFVFEEVSKKSNEIRKEVKDLKLQTPEGQEERKQEFRTEIKEHLKGIRWDESISKNYFVREEYLNEAKNYGKEGDQIIKQAINEDFQEKNEEITLSRKIDQELGLLKSFEDGYINLDSKVEELKNLKKNLPNILAEEIEKNSGLKKACWRYFESPNADYILKHSFFSNYLLEDIDEWFSRTEDLCQEGKEMVSSDYSHLKDKVINAIDLNKDTERMLNLFTDLKKNITKELSNYIKSEKGKTEKSIELESIFLKPKADYLFKPQEEVKEILRKKDLNEAKRELEEKIEGISIKVSSKIDLDWLEVEKGLFEKKNKTRAIENKKRNIEERKEKAEKSLGNLDEVEKNLNEYLGEVIKIDDVEESFRSPELKDSINQTDKQIKEIKNKIDDNSKQIGEKDRQSRKVSKGRWQVGMDNLKSEKKKLDEGLERLQKDREEQVDRWSQLNDLSKILRDFDLSQEFNGKELTIGSTLKILRDKLTVIQSKEGLFSEEQAIYQNWQGLEAQIKEAEDKYSESKKEFPNF